MKMVQKAISYNEWKIHQYFDATETQYLKIVIEKFGIIPAGRQGGGFPSWLFVDEIVVNQRIY